MPTPRRMDLPRIREWISYDPESGIFRWKKGRNGVRAGDIAGTRTSYGYWAIAFDCRRWPGHVLAWVMHYGVWPSKQLDHINRIGSDNRIINLREATPSQQQANKWIPSRSKTGFKGVNRKGSKFIAKIQIDGKIRHLGTFGKAEDASEAYKSAARAHFGEFATFEDSYRTTPPAEGETK